METEQLREALRQGIITVKFTKADGSLRVMRCTTSSTIVPEDAKPTGKMMISEETAKHTLRVYDVEVGGWRSFKLDSIQEVSND